MLNNTTTAPVSQARKPKPTVSALVAADAIEDLLMALSPARKHFSLVACARFARAETLVQELRGLS